MATPTTRKTAAKDYQPKATKYQPIPIRRRFEIHIGKHLR